MIVSALWRRIPMGNVITRYEVTAVVDGSETMSYRLTPDEVADFITGSSHYNWSVISDSLGFTVTTVTGDGELFRWDIESFTDRA